MVKAGVYLLARCAPLFAGREVWMELIVLVGLTTAVVGAGIALRQYDLKMLLAYSTVSSLGTLTALVGVGTFRALAAASLYTVAHALFKASLFMVVGIVDREAGSRDIRALSGLRKAMPITAAVTGAAALSMAGVPPFLGFVAKEEIFGAFLERPGAAWFVGLATTLALLTSVMTFAYSARIFHGAFGGPLTQHLYEPARSFLAPAAVGAVLGFVLGTTPSVLDAPVAAAAEAATGRAGSVGLALWHGLKPPLAMSAIAIVGGIALFASRHRLDRVTERLRVPVTGAAAFDRTYEGTLAVGRAVGAPFLSEAPAVHLGWILGTCAAAGFAAWLVWSPEVGGAAPPSAPLDWLAVGLIGIAAIGIARARARIGAVALTGIVGFLVAVVYLSYGGPDLAMTQLAVETLTVAILVLVFRRLSPTFAPVARARRRAAALGGLAVGLLATAGAYVLTGRRPLSEAGAYFLRAAPAEAGGRNVVNTILVDFRALDTLGETTVLAVAAIGIVALIGAARGGR
jgi:multicomponent Na+:H+ antiporter subunit A